VSVGYAHLPDTIVMFRLSDFYESFDDDAKKVAEACNIVLIGRDMGIGQRVPLAGVPYHTIETYLARLIAAVELDESSIAALLSRSTRWLLSFTPETTKGITAEATDTNTVWNPLGQRCGLS
jgi:hypothetical protein